MQTYSNKSNAKRAALKELKKAGILNPVVDKDFSVHAKGKRFIWSQNLVDQKVIEQETPKTKSVILDQTGIPVFSSKNLKGKVRQHSKPVEPVKASSKRQAAVIQNNVRKPIKGKCADIWALCDELNKELGRCPKFGELKPKADEIGSNETNAKIEYYQWRRFHGIKGRI